MKITYVGGGSLRVLTEIRALFANASCLMQGSEIVLNDFDEARVQAMAALIRKIPEAAGSGLRVTVESSLEKAVEGADFVEITACPWSGRFFDNCRFAANRNGFVSSVNISMTGAFLGVKSVGLALRVARCMETSAPNATLICFTNPIALLAGAVHRNTKIRAIGICAGQTNYIHNVAHVMGWSKPDWDLEAEAAGVNHASWLMGLSRHGKDLLPEFKRQLDAGIDYDRLKSIGNYQSCLSVQLPMMVYCYKLFGAIHYSLEAEGLPLLGFYAETLERGMKGTTLPHPPTTPLPEESAAAAPSARPPHVEEFIGLAKGDLPDGFWDEDGPKWAKPQPFKHVVGARMIKGLSTDFPETLAVSYFNQGAIAGFADDQIVEATMRICSGRIERHATYRLPPVVNGLTHMLVEHQTLISDAIAQEDPDLFLRGLYAFPLCRSRQAVEAFVSETVNANWHELPKYIRRIRPPALDRPGGA